MHGATLLYARGLAEVRQHDNDRRDLADKALDAWAERIAERPNELGAWVANLDAFFALVGQQRRTYSTEQTFVRRWSAICPNGSGGGRDLQGCNGPRAGSGGAEQGRQGPSNRAPR